MEFLMRFGLGLGLAGAAGIRAYFPLLVMGLLTRFSETMGYTEPFRFIASVPVLLILTAFAAFEVIGGRVSDRPYGNQALLIVAVRSSAGAIAFAGTFTGFGVFGGLLFGAIVAVVVNLILVRLRPDFGKSSVARRGNASPGLEDAAAVTGTVLAILLPWSSFILWTIISFIAVRKLRDNNSRYRSEVKARSWR